MSRLLFLFIFAVVLNAQSETAPSSPSSQQSASYKNQSGGSGLVGECQEIMRQAGCDLFLKENKGAQPYGRKCDAGFVDTLADNLEANFLSCPRGVAQAWGSWGADLYEKAQKGIEVLQEQYKKSAKHAEDIKACDEGTSLACRRHLAINAGMPDLTDAQIARLSTRELIGFVERHQRFQNRQKAIQEMADYAALPYEEKKKKMEESKEKSKQAGRELWKKINQGATAFYQTKIKLPLTCYNEAKRQELICQYLASVLTPDMVVGAAVVNKLRKIAGVAEVVADEAGAGAKLANAIKNPARLEKEPTMIDGQSFYRVIPDKDGDALAKHAYNEEKKHGAKVYVQESTTINVNGEVVEAGGYTFKDEAGKTVIAYPKRTLENQEAYAELRAHEGTHSSNIAREDKGQELGRIRGVRFSAEGNLRFSSDKLYQKNYSVDEVHGYTVSAGVESSSAQKALAAGNLDEAVQYANQAERAAATAKELQEQSTKNFDKAIEHLQNRNPSAGDKNKWTYEGKSGDAVVTIHEVGPSRTIERNVRGRPMQFSSGPSYERKMTVEFKLPPGLSEAEAAEEAAKFLKKAQTDAQRFSQAIENSSRRAREVCLQVKRLNKNAVCD